MNPSQNRLGYSYAHSDRKVKATRYTRCATVSGQVLYETTLTEFHVIGKF